MACSCSLLDLCGAKMSIYWAGSSSSSWDIVGTYVWRELGGGVTCDKMLGVLYGSLKSMVFLFSNGIRITPFGVGIGTWNEMYGSFPGNFCLISLWISPSYLSYP